MSCQVAISPEPWAKFRTVQAVKPEPSTSQPAARSARGVRAPGRAARNTPADRARSVRQTPRSRTAEEWREASPSGNLAKSPGLSRSPGRRFSDVALKQNHGRACRPGHACPVYIAVRCGTREARYRIVMVAPPTPRLAEKPACRPCSRSTTPLEFCSWIVRAPPATATPAPPPE